MTFASSNWRNLREPCRPRWPQKLEWFCPISEPQGGYWASVGLIPPTFGIALSLPASGGMALGEFRGENADAGDIAAGEGQRVHQARGGKIYGQGHD
jgi:hypothetical protein